VRAELVAEPPLERGVAGPKLFDRLWADRAALASSLAGSIDSLARRAASGFDRLAELAEGAVA